MREKFIPDLFLDSVYDMDLAALRSRGIRAFLFDIDNTLVHHGEDATEEINRLFRDIQGIGLQTLLLSNNNEARILRFLRDIDSLYICEAQKPRIENYLKGVAMLGLRKEEVVCIGDQIFTDIYGANRSGIDSILVRYMRYADETKIGIRRNLEKVVLKLYSLNKSCQNRIGDIQKEAV